MKAATALYLAASAEGGAAAPPPEPQSIHYDANSWGTKLRSWTFGPSGRGRIEQGLPDLRGDRRTVARDANIGVAGYRELVRILAFAERLAARPYSCRAEITDMVYGTASFRRGGRETLLRWNAGCRAPRDRQLHAALQAADQLVERLSPARPTMHGSRDPAMLPHPEHSPQ